MSRRSSRIRRRQRSSGEGLGYIIIAVALVVIVGFGILYSVVSKNQVELLTDLCRSDGFVARDTVLLIDATDSYSESQRDQVLLKINEYIDDSLKSERLSLYALSEDPDAYLPAFSICNPGDGSDGSEWTQNIERLARTWKTEFKDALTAAVEPLVGQNSAENSPIIEMLKFVGIRTFLESNSSEKRIILVSDMMEHTDGYSHYENPIDFTTIEDTPYERSLRPNLNGVNVEVLYLYRPELASYQNRGHIEKFWAPLVSVSGGRFQSATTIN